MLISISSCTGLCLFFTKLGNICLYLCLMVLDMLAGILLIAIPVVLGATIVSGLWWLICATFAWICGKEMPRKNWVLGTIWASAMSIILYHSTKKYYRRRR